MKIKYPDPEKITSNDGLKKAEENNKIDFKKHWRWASSHSNDKMSHQLSALLKSKFKKTKEKNKKYNWLFLVFILGTYIPFFTLSMLSRDFLFNALTSILITLTIFAIIYISSYSLLRFFIKRKEPALIKTMNLFLELDQHINEVPSFSGLYSFFYLNKKYDFKKLSDALDNYDFQSSDLSLFLKENLPFPQSYLKVLNSDETKELYDKLSSMGAGDEMNILVSLLEEKTPVRKYFELYLLSHFEKRQEEINKNIEKATNIHEDKAIKAIIENHKKQNHFGQKHQKEFVLEIKNENIKEPSRQMESGELRG